MTLTLQAVLDRGLTYRRLDHWTTAGYLRPVHRGGTGHNRQWPQNELQVADLMRRLVDAGLTVEVAALAARAHLDGRPLVKLAPGILLTNHTDQLAEAGERCG
jgi:DNA-binding transcriptional MerR regulator